MAASFLDWVEDWSPSWALGELSAGWYGTLAGLRADMLAEGMRIALLGAWLDEPESPDDVLALAGAEYRMPRYPSETAAQYRARLLTAFTRHANAGTPARINAEIADAQLDGTVLFQPLHPGPLPDLVTPYWSQFFILTTETEADPLGTLRGIAKRWKSVQWMFRAFVFDVDAIGRPVSELAVSEGAVSE